MLQKYCGFLNGFYNILVPLTVFLLWTTCIYVFPYLVSILVLLYCMLSHILVNRYYRSVGSAVDTFNIGRNDFLYM